ncbi:ribosome-recycling factor [Patescibacteria group bacterium]
MEQFQKIIDRYTETLKGVQAGRAEPSLIEKINVDVYGQQTPLNQVATISVPEPALFVCQPWDQNNIGALEKALNDAEISLSVSSDGGVVRAKLPELTAERREELVKLVSQKKEEARIEIRQTRENLIKDLKKGDLSEDDINKQQTDIDDAVTKSNDEVDLITKNKEEALRQV